MVVNQNISSKLPRLLAVTIALLCGSFLVSPSYAYHGQWWDLGHGQQVLPLEKILKGYYDSLTPEEQKKLAEGGDPITLKYGSFPFSHRDLHIRGRGLSIDIVRSYNSQDDHDGPLGYGWNFTYNIQAIEVTDEQNIWVIIRRGDNARHIYTDNRDGTYTAPASVYTTLTRPEGRFLLREKDGTEWRFDDDGRLAAVVDRNGDTITIQRDSNGYMEAIIDPASRAVQVQWGVNGRISGFTDWAGRSVSYVYDAQGNLVEYHDTLGGITRYAYDSNHNLTTTTDPKGQLFRRNYYDAQDRVTRQDYGDGYYQFTYSAGYTTVRDRRGNNWTYYYNQDGNPIREIDPLGNETWRAWDPNMNLLAVRFPNGNGIQYTYDDRGNATEIRRKVSFTQWGTGTPFSDDMESGTGNWSAQSPWGLTTATYHSPTHCWTDSPSGNYANNRNISLTLGQPIDLTGVSAATLTFWNRYSLESGYDYGYVEISSDGGPWTQLTRFNGHNTTWHQVSYSLSSYVGHSIYIRFRLYTDSSVTYDGWYLDDVAVTVGGYYQPDPPSSSDIVTVFEYEPTYSLITRKTDALGNVTQYSYDANGNLLQITYPQDAAGRDVITRYSYNSAGQVASVTDPAGVVTQYQYDAATGYRTMGIRDSGGLNLTWAYSYDTVGNVVSTTDPRGNTTAYQYDAAGQRIRVTDPAPFNYVTYLSYDGNGNLQQVRRATGDAGNPWQTTTYAYNSLDNLVTDTDPLGHNIVYAYDAEENQTSVTDRNGNTTAYQYEAANRLIRITNALGNVTQYSYDGNGNRASVIDAKGNTTTYTYDGFDRHVRTTYPAGSSEQYAYDARGDILARSNRAGQTITYSYDALGRRITKTSIQYAYDTAGRRTDVSDALGTIHYDYDRIGRVIQVTYPSGRNVGYSYDTSDNRTQLTYPDGSSAQYAYDQLGRMTDATYQGQPVAHFDYDPVSRRTGRIMGNGTTTAYTYDQANRLLSIAHAKGDGSSLCSYAYTYDNMGNRLSMTVDGTHVHGYTYDPIYQLAAVDYPDGFFQPDTTFTYDAVGNRVSVTNGGTTDYVSNSLNQYASVGGTSFSYDLNGNLTSDAMNSYTYDVENRLVSATSGPKNAAYAFDAYARRVSKGVDGTTTEFVYSGDQVVAEYESGAIERVYVYGASVDETLLLINGAERFYYHADSLGSTVGLTAASGNLHEKYEYGAYGRHRVLDPATSSVRAESLPGNPYCFTGRRFDNEIGHYHYRAREYSPSHGRFMQPDPLGYMDTTNLCSYVGNNPLNWTDPFGLLIDIKGPDKASVYKAIEYLSKSKTFSDTWTFLDGRSETYTITTNSSQNDSYSPSSNTVNWDPTAALKTTSGGTMSPSLPLAHELEHARNDAEGDIDYTPDSQYDFVEEKNVITGPETQIAKDRGEDTRTDHSGSFYSVKGPTKRK